MSQTGKFACLVINDLDAGVGAFRATQRTVNMQMVMGTLMNLCDHPNRTSTARESTPLIRSLTRAFVRS